MESKNNSDKPLAVIYVRVSTKEQVDEGNSIVTQERICKQYAAKQGWDVVKVFSDKGESAKTADRPELQAMLAFCAEKKNAISYVVVYKVDRLARNTDDYSFIRLSLRSSRVELRSATEVLEDTPVGRFLENTLANVAQFDNDVRAERCSNGMKEAMREGRYVWMAPIGYNNVSVANKATIAPNETMAPIVLVAFNNIASERYSTDEAWKEATKNGLCKKNGKPVTRNYFHAMLKNELYTGWVKKFGERHKGVFTAIVPEPLFYKVQKVLAKRGRRSDSYSTDNPEFPLRRFIRSPTEVKLTGAFSTGRSGTKYPFYRFTDGGTNYQRDAFHVLFTSFMDSFAISDDRLAKLHRFVKEKFVMATKNERAHTERIRARLKEIEVLEDNLVERMIDMTPDTFKRQMERLRREEGDLKALMVDSIHELPNVDDALAYASEYLRSPSSIWIASPIQTRLKLQRFQFPSGVMFDGQKFETAELCCIFSLKSEKTINWILLV